jgi:2-amino-4-hydroxy-6-hydroxymethyldihydropteridine diphosphokinase
MKKKLVLSLGSNLGNRYAYLQQAIIAINETFDTVSHVAQFYETPPWGDTNQSRFINTALLLETALSPQKCIALLQEIERTLGRIKTHKWGPRSIDIDILFYENEVLLQEDMIIPHPHLQNRAFVLAPLCDLIPAYRHPVLAKDMTDLLANLDNDTKLFVP